MNTGLKKRVKKKDVRKKRFAMFLKEKEKKKKRKKS